MPKTLFNATAKQLIVQFSADQVADKIVQGLVMPGTPQNVYQVSCGGAVVVIPLDYQEHGRPRDPRSI